MSADNQIVVQKIDGAWHVWEISCSASDQNLNSYSRYHKTFCDELDAIHYAQDVCDNDIVEYGIELRRGG